MNKKSLIITVIFIIVAGLVVILIARKDNLSSMIKNSKVNLVSGSSSKKAADLEAKGNLLGAVQIYQKLINDFPNSGEIMHWQKKAEELNIKLLFSPTITPKSTSYEIKPGDTLTKIAKEFNTTVELISKSNNLSDNKIMPGRKIKVWTAPFSILVDKSQNILMLKADEEIVKTYIVSTGTNNSTPSGTFKIVNKIQNPTWFKAGTVVPAGSPENILGSRWLGFNLPGYGIHGTTEPQSLGKQVTQGCVRMSNADVEELYTIIPPETEVTIVE